MESNTMQNLVSQSTRVIKKQIQITDFSDKILCGIDVQKCTYILSDKWFI